MANHAIDSCKRLNQEISISIFVKLVACWNNSTQWKQIIFVRSTCISIFNANVINIAQLISTFLFKTKVLYSIENVKIVKIANTLIHYKYITCTQITAAICYISKHFMPEIFVVVEKYKDIEILPISIYREGYYSAVFIRETAWFRVHRFSCRKKSLGLHVCILCT